LFNVNAAAETTVVTKDQNVDFSRIKSDKNNSANSFIYRKNVDMYLFSNAMTITAKRTSVNNVYSSPNKSVSLEKHSGPTASNCKERTRSHENTAANADEVAPAVLTVRVNNCSNKILQIAKSFASHLSNSFFSSLLLPTITGLAITHVYAITKRNAAIQTRIATVYPAPELSGHLTHSPSCSKKPSAQEAHKVSAYLLSCY